MRAPVPAGAHAGPADGCLGTSLVPERHNHQPMRPMCLMVNSDGHGCGRPPNAAKPCLKIEKKATTPQGLGILHGGFQGRLHQVERSDFLVGVSVLHRSVIATAPNPLCAVPEHPPYPTYPRAALTETSRKHAAASISRSLCVQATTPQGPLMAIKGEF